MRQWEKRIGEDKAHIESSLSSRSREKREIRQKIARGVIGAAIFQKTIEKRVAEGQRSKKERPRK